MMNFDEFKEKVAKEMKQRLGEGEVILQNIMKNNDTRLTGLSILSPNTNLSPTIYLEKYYQDMQSKTFAQVVDEIWKVYSDNRPTKDVNVALFKRWDLAKARIVMKLVNYEYNRELLKTVPYDRFLDLAVIYYYVLDISAKGAATILIHNIKISVLKDLAKVLHTNASYLVDGDENDIAPEIMQVAMMLQEIQNKDLRKAAIEQMKILVGLNDAKI